VVASFLITLQLLIRMKPESNNALTEIIDRLRELASRGPIRGVDQGDSSVGITMLRELGIDSSSIRKPAYRGIVISAARKKRQGSKNRVNLFAQVPDWSISKCKSSREILEKYGYESEQGDTRLYCTVTSRRINSQGLRLNVSKTTGRLDEQHIENGLETPVAAWSLDSLKARLLSAHPESIWVRASVHQMSGYEEFFYREATYTGSPKVDRISELIESGTISVDHLISKRDNKVSEKGPLFKIGPENLGLLFPNQRVFSLI